MIIAGEKSGEDHCLSFYDDMKKLCPEFHFWGVGGDRLNGKGMEILYHLKDFSSWGISEVISKIPFYYKALDRIEMEVVKRDCKVAILIDFQDFNLRLAKKLKSRGVKILYYVAPQAWAWKEYRATVLEETVDTLFSIIKFEKKWFQDRGVKKIVSVDHPLYAQFSDTLKENPVEKKSFEKINESLNILLLPGSRNSELSYMVDDFFQTAKYLKNKYNAKVSIVLSSNVNPSFIEPYKSLLDEVYTDDDLEKALRESDIAIASSGTVTLTCALFEVPTIVCYKGSLLNEFIFYQLIQYSGDVSLANIVHQKRVYPELVQERCTVYNIRFEIEKILSDKSLYSKTLETLKETKSLIRGEGIDTAKYIGDALRTSYERK